MGNKIYNLKADNYDERDFLFGDYIKEKTVELPKEVDLRNNLPCVFSQNNQGSCTSQGTVANLEYLEYIKTGNKPILSRQYFYNKERINDGTPLTEDSGSSIRNAAKTACQNGCAEEPFLIYKEENMTIVPSLEADSNAQKHKGKTYRRICSFNEAKLALAQGLPILLGITVYDSFETVSGDGKIPIPNTTKEQVLGGHCVLCVGYRSIENKCILSKLIKSVFKIENSKTEFIIRNSWGLSVKNNSSWGYAFNNPTDGGWGENNSGYGYASEAVMKSIVQDMWIITMD